MLSNTRLFDYLYPLILPAILTTIKILLFSFVICVFFGLILGVILFVSKENGLRPNRFLYNLIDKFANMIRSFPTLIFIVSIAPLTRLVLKTSIGASAAIFAITLASIPYAIRMTEISLETVSKDVIQAAQSFGASNFQIITRVMLVEAMPSLISNYTLMMVNMLNMTAIAGAVGAGGLGAVALTYGYQQFDYSITYFIVIILMIFVFVIEKISKKIKEKLN